MPPEFAREFRRESPREFPRPLPLGLVGAQGRTERLVADSAERAALAERFGIVSVESVEADLTLRQEPDGAVLASGRLVAAVTQACVVSFEPVAQQVVEAVCCRLLPAGREPADGPDDIDEIPCEHDVADLGEVVAEQLSLALDPYPRAPGAALPPEVQEDAGAFQALSRLRRPH